MTRCFGDGDPLYERYHDEEWGRPVTDERGLFERMSLEAFQSGLSWLTILRKREAFRAAFANFEPDAVARFGDDDVERLLQDAGIVRNRAKIEATIDDRNGRIDGDIAAAEAARAQAHAVEAAYQTGLENARSKAALALGEAKDRATANTEAKLKASDASMQAQLVAATAQVAASKTQAFAEIETATTDAVEAIVAKLSGVAVDRSTIEARVKTELAHG